MTSFLKMHGLGNDFVVFDARNGPLSLTPMQAQAIADRRLGVGCDQVIVIEKADGADARMRIYNADGGEVESCGNAARCIAQLLFAESQRREIHIDTEGGLLVCSDADGLVTIDMGTPKFGWRDIPLSKEVDTNSFAVELPPPVAGGGEPPPNRRDGEMFAKPVGFRGGSGEGMLTVSAVSVGNPHCVLFVGDADAAPVASLGPAIEYHPLFPERTNAEFVQVLSPQRLRMRVWERGVGITRACGTGACASVAAAQRRGLCGNKVDVVLDGGTLTVEWRAGDSHIFMTGPAALSFRGEIDLDRF
jgi:diaminopimelate epimerase